MKKSILIMLLSCCMIIVFSIPVLATSYTWTQGGGATKVKYDLKSVDEAFVMKAIQEACGTTENVYYVCCLTEAFINDPEYYGNVYIFIMLNVEDVGIKGNVGYVKDDSNGLYTDSFNTVPHWKEISISDNGKYMSRYNDCSSSSPWTRYVGMPECVTITNIPVFYTKEGLDEYFATGNTSDMIGAEAEYDSSVKIPEQVHIEKRFLSDEWIPRITLSFNSPCCFEDFGYKSEVRYRFTGEFFETGVFGESQKNRLNFQSSFEKINPFETYYQNSVGNTSKANTYQFNYFDTFENNYKVYSEYKTVESNKNVISFVGTKIKIIEIWVRNIDSYNHSSDWVKCIYDIEHDKLVETWTDQVVTGTSTVIDGNIEPGNESVSNIKDSYEITENINDNNESGIVGYITSGFGLIGDNGLIPMLGQIFSFLPKELITLLVSTFGIVCMVIVIKFVRG